MPYLKYRDLPWKLKRLIDTSGPMMQPRKSENPTVKHILSRLKRLEQKAISINASDNASQKRETIENIEEYLLENNMDVTNPRQAGL